MSHEQNKIPIAPEWQAFLAKQNEQIYVACMLLRAEQLFVGWKHTDGKRAGHGGCPGGTVADAEFPRDAAKRYCLSQAGVDLTAHFPFYLGQRKFNVKGIEQPVHLFVCFLDWAAEPSTGVLDRALRRADWTPEQHDKWNASVKTPDPQVIPGSRFDEWEAVSKDRWFQTQSTVGEVLQWGLEVLLHEPPPFEEETVQISTAGHLKHLINE